MAIFELNLNKDGGRPEVEVLILKQQFGEYNIKIRHGDGSRSPIGDGDNINVNDDRFSLQKLPADLAGKFITWHIIIYPTGRENEQDYEWKVIFYQDGRQIQEFSDKGSFDLKNEKPIPEVINCVARVKVS